MIDNLMTSKELPDWFTDLLILRATDGLDVEQQQQFEQFVSDHPDRDQLELEAEKYELSIAAIDLGMTSVANASSENSQNEIPKELRQKVLDGAKRHFESIPAEEQPIAIPAPVAIRKSDNMLTSREALAWLAAAAAVVLMLTGWNPFAIPTTSGVDDSPVATRSIEDQYSDFVSGNPEDLVRSPWEATNNSIATGEVVWRDSSQRGFMVFENMKPNNPAQSQYQLWIFDANTGDQHPIDGGVFDIAAGVVESIIPIDARIPVTDAFMFAITEEKPGGVVVSDRKRLPLLAEVTP